MGKGKGSDRASADPYATPSDGDFKDCDDTTAWTRGNAATKDLQLMMDNGTLKAQALQKTLARLEAAQAEVNIVLSEVSVLTTPDKEL